LGFSSRFDLFLHHQNDFATGVDAGREVILMVQEKVEAAAEAQTTLMGGGSAEAVLVGYRRRVALNAERLSTRSAR